MGRINSPEKVDLRAKAEITQHDFPWILCSQISGNHSLSSLLKFQFFKCWMYVAGWIFFKAQSNGEKPLLFPPVNTKNFRRETFFRFFVFTRYSRKTYLNRSISVRAFSPGPTWLGFIFGRWRCLIHFHNSNLHSPFSVSWPALISYCTHIRSQHVRATMYKTRCQVDRGGRAHLVVERPFYVHCTATGPRENDGANNVVLLTAGFRTGPIDLAWPWCTYTT